MESISQLVGDSLARHGIEPSLDHLRLEWSKWFRCESSFSVLLVPAKAGIFALAEEVAPSLDIAESWASLRQAQGGLLPVDGAQLCRSEGKRILAVFQISEADDLGMALGRLFLPGNPLREKLETGKCFTRYAVIEDAAERAAAYDVFQRWIQDSTEEFISRGAA